MIEIFDAMIFGLVWVVVNVGPILIAGLLVLFVCGAFVLMIKEETWALVLLIAIIPWFVIGIQVSHLGSVEKLFTDRIVFAMIINGGAVFAVVAEMFMVGLAVGWLTKIGIDGLIKKVRKGRPIPKKKKSGVKWLRRRE